MDRAEVRRILGAPLLAADDVDFYASESQSGSAIDIWKPNFVATQNSLHEALSRNYVHSREVWLHRIYYSNEHVKSVIVSGNILNNELQLDWNRYQFWGPPF